MQLGDKVYWVRETLSGYDLIGLKIRTIKDTYFVGVENDTKLAFPFSYKDIYRTIFYKRDEGLRVAKELEKHSNKKKYTEICYEEY